MKTEGKKTTKKEDKVISLTKAEAIEKRNKRKQVKNTPPEVKSEKSTSSSKTL